MSKINEITSKIHVIQRNQKPTTIRIGLPVIRILTKKFRQHLYLNSQYN